MFKTLRNTVRHGWFSLVLFVGLLVLSIGVSEAQGQYTKAEFNKEGFELPKVAEEFREASVIVCGVRVKVYAFRNEEGYLCARLSVIDNVYAYTVDTDGDNFGDYYLVNKYGKQDSHGRPIFQYKIPCIYLKHPLCPPEWAVRCKCI